METYPRRLTPLRAIRAFCLECVGDSPSEVEACPSVRTCPLWPYRKGHSPVKRGRRPNTVGLQSP